MFKNVKEADITFKARGKEFEFIKIVYLEEKDHCTMKIQEVIFGDFKFFEVPNSEFEALANSLGDVKSPFPGYSDGKEGSHYQLEIQSGENAMNYNWYGETPGEAWDDIIGFTQKLIALKDKFLKD